MKIIYYSETDPMFIDLSSKKSAESSEVFPYPEFLETSINVFFDP